MNKKYSKIILQAVTSIIFCITVLFSGCSHDYDANVTIHFKGNNISANIEQKNIIDRILGFFSKPAYAVWSIPCNRLTLTISGPEIDQQFNDTGYIDTGINEYTFTAVVPAVDNVTFKVLSYEDGDEATPPNWGASRTVSLRPGKQTIDMAMLPMTSISGITMVDDGSLKVSFEDITGFCSGYNIYRSTEENGNYELIAFIENTGETISFSAQNLDFSKTYYRVSVINNSGVEGVLSDAMQFIPPNNLYTVAFNSNGGSNVGDQIVVGGLRANKPDPTRAPAGFYKVAGWFKDALLTDEWAFETDIVTYNITLYAKWAPSKVVGDSGPGGGIIFYVADGKEGRLNGIDFYTGTTAGDLTYEKRYYLEAAPTDLPDVSWSPAGIVSVSTMADIGYGWRNTKLLEIIALGVGGAAAKECLAARYEGGYSDWFLPSKDELDELYKNKGKVGNLENSLYWSSTQADTSNAYAQHFSNGDQSPKSKTSSQKVRAIRAF